MWFAKVLQRNTVRKALTITGLVIINLPNGILWYGGNLTTYTNSYFIAASGPDTYTGTIIMMSSFMAMWTFGLLFFSKVIQYISRRYSAILGIFIFNATICLCYFAVRHSPVALILTLGVMAGLCVGNFLALTYNYVMVWTTGNDVGFSAGLASQTTLGAVLVNQLITLYINPKNLTPDLETSETKYFTQPDIVSRVPYVFLVMGSVFLVVQLLGFALLMEPSDRKHNMKQNMGEDTNSISASVATKKGYRYYDAISESPFTNGDVRHDQTCPSQGVAVSENQIGNGDAHHDQACQCHNEVSENQIRNGDGHHDQTCHFHKDGVSENQIRNGHVYQDQTCHCHKDGVSENQVRNGDVSHGQTSQNDKIIKNCSLPDSVHEKANGCLSLNNITDTVDIDNVTGDTNTAKQMDKKFLYGDLTPLQILKHKEFYFISFSYGSLEYSFSILATYYKAFGQIWISDDHFMAALGTSITAGQVVARILWGIFCDRVGVKTSCLLQLSCSSILALFIYWTPRLNQWIYFAWTCSLFMSLIGGLGVLSVAIYKCFGDSHFSANLGVASASSLVVNLISPWLVGVILNQLGWVWVLCSIGIFQVLSLLLAIGLVPNNI